MRMVLYIWLLGLLGCRLFHKSAEIQKKPLADTVTSIPFDSIYAQGIDSTCEQKLHAYVQKYWSYDDSVSHYYWISNGLGIHVLPELFPCFIGMDTTECFKLLGRPHQQQPVGYMYYYFGNCFDFESRINVSCYFFLIRTKNGLVTNAEDTGISKQE